MSNTKHHLEYQTLKSNLVSVLTEKDLTGQIIYSRDLVSDFLGGALDHDISGMNDKLTIQNQDASFILVTDDFDEEITVDLNDLGLEILIGLLD
jgi:hypothetical protein